MPLQARLLFAACLLAGCAALPGKEEAPAAPPAPKPTPEALAAPAPICPKVDCVCPPAPECPPVKEAPKEPPKPRLEPAAWDSLPGYAASPLLPSWDAFLTGCAALAKKPDWSAVCVAATRVPRDEAAVRAFFNEHFEPWQLLNGDGSDTGLVTGYYEPLIRGSRKPGGRYRFPVYGVPDDLVVVDLADLYPELKNLRLRGRLEGRRLVPYWTREDIDRGTARLAGKEILWADDAVELFFLQVQGSGQVQLAEGGRVRIGYADQNGHSYRSIGRLLVERGDLKLEQASMQGIKDWGARNPAKLPELLNANPSYVFFRELPARGEGPPGALGVPVTGGYSIAVDPRSVPLGAPVWLSTTQPLSEAPLERLVMAQDTGGAIKGGVRADFFWGFGPEAGAQAGRMRQKGRMWVLMPKGWKAEAPR